MSLNEVIKTIAESSNRDWYNQFSIEINNQNSNVAMPISGVVSIYQFIQNQIEEFTKYENLPPEFQYILNTLRNSANKIVELLKSNNTDQHSWRNNLTPLTNYNQTLILSNSPVADFLIRLFGENPSYYNGAYSFFNGKTNNPHDKNYFIGYLLAYEFENKDISSLVKRKESDKKSIIKIQNEFQKSLENGNLQLIEYLANVKDTTNENLLLIEQFRVRKEEEFELWYTEKVGQAKRFADDSIESIKHLEELYQEKLKLEAPATYWRLRAVSLRKEGNQWLYATIGCLAVSIIILCTVLQKISDGTIHKIFSETGTAVRWSIAFVTLISFLAFALRTFSKLTFSSFHLVRDAEEREQLTYVYLALHKEKGIDQTERHLIMQSLFSRADSGLLKDDASPTMPGNIIDHVTRR